MIIDSHCHLNLYEEKELDVVIKNAFDASVTTMLTICTKISELDEILKIAAKHPNIYATVGVHPCEANGMIDVDEFISLTLHQKVIGIGETGLDYYHPNFKKSEQIDSFLKHIHASQVTKLPLIIHSRSADADMIQILKTEYAKKEFTAVLHCFSSSIDLFYTAMDLNIFISFSGIITFKNANDIRNIAAQTPKSNLLIETDAPFLAPHPHRSKKNQPAFIVHTLEILKNIKKDNESIKTDIQNNFHTLFKKAKIMNYHTSNKKQ